MVPSAPQNHVDLSKINEDVNDINEPVPGWPAITSIIATEPSLEIFPSFADLNIKSLLYYQAELISLRKKLHKVEWEDSNSEGLKSKFAGNVGSWFIYEDDDDDSDKPEQLRLIEKIRKVLEKYNAALLQYSRISTFQEADSANIKSLKNCIWDVTKSSLHGPGSRTWGKLRARTEDHQTLVSLLLGLITGIWKSADKDCNGNEFQEQLIVPREGPKPDGLTLWIKHSLVPLLDYAWKAGKHWLWIPVYKSFTKHRSHSHDSEKGDSNRSNSSKAPVSRTSSSPFPGAFGLNVKKNLTSYTGPFIVRTAFIITTVIACLLPTVAITVLAKVHGMGRILGLIAAFTGVFAFGLVFLSPHSTRVDIFTASAAFSAVMVVFVQNQISPG